ncbi:MAG: T9SS type A sorting domain-containing protein [Crocinitomicaceae bacterium]|nr:T9SS type A sorting domain-containing protein [Crocinitomicaceae bacterium]
MKKGLSILFVFIATMVSSQTILDDFALDLNQGKVLLAWTIKSGSVCNGIEIYRSTIEDSLNFELIEDIQGVCGDLSSPVAYTFTDENPLQNQVNYYKLLLGGQEFSEVLGIEVLLIPSNSYLLKPHPIVSSSSLYFYNSNNNDVELKVFDDFGSVVYKNQTNSNRFILDSSMISSGLYYFTLENKSNKSIINGRALFLE